MERLKNYYRILNIDSTADAPTIKTAFRALARRYHPDVAENAGAARRFREIREAYEVLSDPKKRHRYDRVHRAQTALRPVLRRRERPTGGASARAGSRGLGITLDLLGLRLGLAIDARASPSAARTILPRRQSKKR